MIEGYTTEEVIECYADYIKGRKVIGVPVSRHHRRLTGKGTKGKKIIHDNSFETVRKAHYTVMNQLAIMRPYVEQYLKELREKNRDHDEEWIIK